MSNHPKSPAGKGLSVDVRGGDVVKAGRRLKKLLTNDGLIRELRERQHFTKPSLKKAAAKKAARKRWLKEQSRKHD